MACEKSTRLVDLLEAFVDARIEDKSAARYDDDGAGAIVAAQDYYHARGELIKFLENTK